MTAAIPYTPRDGDLAKTLTGIRGLDEVTRGGLPTGRPTLVCGGPGSGKTLLALTFLVNGAVRFDEPGVLMTFEENAAEIASDVASLGFDLPGLIEARKLAVDYVRSAAKSRRRVSTTSKDCSSGSTTPFSRWAPSASFWTRSNRSLRVCRIPPSCGQNCGDCSGG